MVSGVVRPAGASSWSAPPPRAAWRGFFFGAAISVSETAPLPFATAFFAFYGWGRRENGPPRLGAELFGAASFTAALALVGSGASFFSPVLNRLKMPRSMDGCATGGDGVSSPLDGAILPS